jgi:hypothetical protein
MGTRSAVLPDVTHLEVASAHSESRHCNLRFAYGVKGKGAELEFSGMHGDESLKVELRENAGIIGQGRPNVG